MEFKFSDAITINPSEKIKKGELIKKISMQNIKERNRNILDYEITPYSSGSKFRNKDTLFARITPCLENGKTAQVNILNDDEIAFGSTEFIVFRARTGITIPDYVYFLSISECIRQQAIKSMTGTSGRQRVQNSIFDEITIEVPSIEVQEKIVGILNSLDSKIEINNKIISNLESQAQAIFKSWFVDFEPFQDGDFVESELGMIPKGWEVKELGEVADCKLGGTPSRKKREFWNGDIPWINSGEVNKDRIIEPSEYITEDGLKNSATKLLKRKTTLVAITGATLGQVSLLEIDCCTNQSIIGIEPNEKIPYEYIYLFIKNNINKIISNQTGAAQQHINLNDIRTSKIIIPQSRIMTEFVKIVSLLMSKVEKNYFENTKLAELRDALLPKLMAGEIDVSNIKIEGEEVKNE